MRLAFSTPTASRHDTNQLFELFVQCGYSGLQLKSGQYAPYLHSPNEFAAEHDPCTGAASALITQGTLEEDGVLALRRLIRFACAIESERIVYCHAIPRDRVRSRDRRRFAKELSELAVEARDQKVALSLHHHDGQPVMFREDLEEFFAAVPDESLGLTLDTAHLAKAGVTDIAGVIRDFAGVVDNVHIKDLADGEFVPLGSGEIDFYPIFCALEAIEFSGWLCADEESGIELGPALRDCRDFILDVAAQAGLVLA